MVQHHPQLGFAALLLVSGSSVLPFVKKISGCVCLFRFIVVFITTSGPRPVPPFVDREGKGPFQPGFLLLRQLHRLLLSFLGIYF